MEANEFFNADNGFKIGDVIWARRDESWWPGRVVSKCTSDLQQVKLFNKDEPPKAFRLAMIKPFKELLLSVCRLLIAFNLQYF